MHKRRRSGLLGAGLLMAVLARWRWPRATPTRSRVTSPKPSSSTNAETKSSSSAGQAAAPTERSGSRDHGQTLMAAQADNPTVGSRTQHRLLTDRPRADRRDRRGDLTMPIARERVTIAWMLGLCAIVGLLLVGGLAGRRNGPMGRYSGSVEPWSRLCLLRTSPCTVIRERAALQNVTTFLGSGMRLSRITVTSLRDRIECWRHAAGNQCCRPSASPAPSTARSARWDPRPCLVWRRGHLLSSQAVTSPSSSRASTA